MVTSLKTLARNLLHRFGIDVIRITRRPDITLMGLRSMNIGVIIDIGANEGQYARKAFDDFPGAKIICFEPAPRPYRVLREWAVMHQDRITAFNYALGDTEGSVDMFCHIEHSPSSSILKTTETCEKLYAGTKQQEVISVQQTTLDRAVGSLGLQETANILIKFDVQGYEDRVIAGGEATIKKARACLLEISLDPLYESQASFRGLFLRLDALGFRYAGNMEQSYANDGHVVYIDALFIKQGSQYS